ncbi:hypothetical protein ACFU5O_05305 [Streptomyces sp. NPDC057445]|uniref:hypothetical protein n=1 Tax=Streptomyces sp. NPDC057445 TaxID=3346136 RepID=UPI0036A4F390
MKKYLLTAAVAGVIALLVAGCSDDDAGAPAGAKSERGAVDAYISALNARDTDALADLAPPGNEAAREAAALVGAKGGRSLTIKSVDISHEFGPDFAAAHVVSRGKDGKELLDDLTLSRSSGHWYVAIGENPKGRDKSPAETSKP